MTATLDISPDVWSLLFGFMAEHAEETPALIPDSLASDQRWAGDPEGLAEAWETFADAITARDALLGGERGVSDFYDPGEVAGVEHAAELKDAEARDAFVRLAGGPR